MNSIIISEVLLTIAILATGVVYGTDMFHALIVRKATAMSKDPSIADLMGHTHLIADKRMPVIGVTSIICTAVCVVLNFNNVAMAGLSGAALFMLLSHLYLYINVAQPINKEMSDAVVNHIVLPHIRMLQIRWESVISYRAAFLTAAMLFLCIALIIYGK